MSDDPGRLVAALKRKKPSLPGDGCLVNFKCASYLENFRSMSKSVVEDIKKEMRMLTPRLRTEFILDNYESLELSKIPGEERLRLYEHLLENGFRWKRHRFQKEFHDKGTMVLAPLIVGTEWSIIGPAISRQRKWPLTRDSRMLLASGPRRIGKTVGVSTQSSALTLVVPNIQQAIFSTGQRIAGYMGEKVRDNIIDAGYEERIKKFGKERMDVTGDDANDTNDMRPVFYYPSCAKIDQHTTKKSFSHSLHSLYFIYKGMLFNDTNSFYSIGIITQKSTESTGIII
jgi:hypothetical protein